MRNLFITLVLLISFSFLGNEIKADTTYVYFDNIINDFDTTIFCYSDTVIMYAVTNGTNIGFIAPGNYTYETTTLTIINDSVYYYDMNENKDSVAFLPEKSGTWSFISPPHNRHARFYFTTPTTEPWTETSQAICGATDTLYAGPIGNDDNYQQGIRYVWRELGATDTIANGFYPNDTSLVVDHTASYIVDIISGCGVTSDTIYMNITTTNPPDLGPDTSFCGEAVYYIARLTETYDSYLWSDGSTADTLIVTAPGTYTVTVNNDCLTDEVVSVTIYHESYPQLDLGPDIVACGGTSVTLNTHFEYDLIRWQNAADSVTFSGGYDTIFTVTSDVNILLKVRQGACEFMRDWIDVTFTEPFSWTTLCIATVDTNGLNKIVWDPVYSGGVESYNVYRVYDFNDDYVYDAPRELVGNLTLDSIASMGHTIMYDQITDPGVQATAYAVTAIDTCGNESDLSPHHKTIWTSAVYTTGLDIALTRTQYIVSDESYIPTTYLVLVDSLSDGNLAILDTMTGGLYYTVIDPYPGADYLIAAGMPYACSGSKSLNSIFDNLSISNKIHNTVTGIKPHNDANLNISIYPNPSTGIFQIRSDQKIDKIEMLNAIGQTILSTNSTSIDLSSYTKGVYFAKVYTTYGPSIHKIILQ